MDYDTVELNAYESAIVMMLLRYQNILAFEIIEKGKLYGVKDSTFRKYKAGLIEKGVLYEKGIGGKRGLEGFEFHDLNNGRLLPSETSRTVIYSLKYNFIRRMNQGKMIQPNIEGPMEMTIDGDIIIHMPGHTYEYKKGRGYRSDNGLRIRPGRMWEEFKKNIEGKKKGNYELVKVKKGTKEKISKGEAISIEDFGGVVSKSKGEVISSVNDIDI